MLKKTVFLIIAIALVCPAWAGEVLVEREVLEKILKNQEELEKQNQRLEQQIMELREKLDQTSPSIETDAEEIKILQEDTEEMSDRLDQVEKKSILDKIQIGGELRTTLEYLNIDDRVVDGQKTDSRIDELWASRLRLNLRSEITEDLIFHGRLSYYKYWGDTNNEDFSYDSEYFAVSHKNGNLHVERAYIDYFVPETPVAISIGRLPLSNGPPYEFKNLTTRKATWPQLFVGGEYDGIISSVALDKWTGIKNNIFQIGYCKIEQNYKQFEDVKIDSMKVLYMSAESQFPGVQNSLLWIGAYKLFDIIPLSQIPDTTFPEDSGTLESYTIHVQFNDIMKSGLGWFGAYTYQNIHPKDEGTQLGPGYEVGLYGDNLHNDLGKRRDGFAFYTGLRYKIPIDILKHPYIGFEYNHGSQYWFSSSIAGQQFRNKLAVSGNAYELYYIQPISKNHMFLRIGAMRQDMDYLNPFSLFGSMESEQVKSDMTIFQTYFIVDVRF